MYLIKKLVLIILIALSLTSVFPTKAYALDGGAGWTLVTKEYGLDGLAWFAGNTVIKKITSQTVNWINSGFKGNPAYVTDPGQFFLNVADQTAANFISKNAALNQLCSPFKAQVRIALVKNYLSSSSSYGENYSCTLGAIKDNFEEFTQDFSKGGWEGWLEVSQNDQNNPYGAYMQAKSSMYAEIGFQNNKYSKQLDMGRGFLSYEKCKESSVVTQRNIEDNSSQGDGSPYAGYSVGECLDNDVETVTPGSVIEKQLNESLGTGLKRIEAADEIDEIIAALMTQLMNKALGSVGGLLGTSRPDSSGRIFTSDLLTDESDRPKGNPETTCTTLSPETTDSEGNTVPAVVSCVPNKPPPDPVTAYCTTGSDGVMICTNTPPSTTPGGQCITPTDAGKHGDHTAEVAAAKNELAAQGMTWDPYASNFECSRLEIVRLAVQKIGDGAMLYPKTSGTNCQGYATDIVAYPDGYIYDVLNGNASDGAGPMWSSATCLADTGTGGTGGGGTAATSLLGDLQNERIKYPSSLASLCTNPTGLEPASCPLGNILNTVAWNNATNGWGLSSKTSGHRCPSPAGEIACDILGHKPTNTIYDTFIDAENAATPMWNYIGTAPRPWVAPVQP